MRATRVVEIDSMYEIPQQMEGYPDPSKVVFILASWQRHWVRLLVKRLAHPDVNFFHLFHVPSFH